METECAHTGTHTHSLSHFPSLLPRLNHLYINAFCENTYSLVSDFSHGNRMVIHPLLRVDWKADLSDTQFTVFGLWVVIVMGKELHINIFVVYVFSSTLRFKV